MLDFRHKENGKATKGNTMIIFAILAGITFTVGVFGLATISWFDN